MATEAVALSSVSTRNNLVRLAVVVLAGYAVFAVMIVSFTPYLDKASHSYDNGEYLAVADAIRSHNFSSVSPRVFWGFSYFIALFGWLLHITNPAAMLVVSMGSGLLSVLLVRSLWGDSVAAFFALTNFAWIRSRYWAVLKPCAC
jgi:hypothetical protein